MTEVFLVSDWQEYEGMTVQRCFDSHEKAVAFIKSMGFYKYVKTVDWGTDFAPAEFYMLKPKDSAGYAIQKMLVE